MLLGKTVIYRVGRKEARTALIVGIDIEGSETFGHAIATLYVFPHDEDHNGRIEKHVGQGWEVGNWQLPEMIPHMDCGYPDYKKLEAGNG